MSDTLEQLEELAQEWAFAELRGDTVFLGSAMTEDFVGVGPRGFTLTREQWLDRHEAGNLKYQSFGLDEVRVRLYGDAAIAVCRQDAEGVYEDENGRYDIHEQFRATLIFVKQEGRWLLAGLQLTPSWAGREPATRALPRTFSRTPAGGAGKGRPTRKERPWRTR